MSLILHAVTLEEANILKAAAAAKDEDSQLAGDGDRGRVRRMKTTIMTPSENDPPVLTSFQVCHDTTSSLHYIYSL